MAQNLQWIILHVYRLHTCRQCRVSWPNFICLSTGKKLVHLEETHTGRLNIARVQSASRLEPRAASANHSKALYLHSYGSSLVGSGALSLQFSTSFGVADVTVPCRAVNLPWRLWNIGRDGEAAAVSVFLWQTKQKEKEQDMFAELRSAICPSGSIELLSKTF